MIIIEEAKGGLWISRDTDPVPNALFIPERELAAFLADLLARATDAPDTEKWDTFAYLCGNDAAANA